jgi:hypothetical protein
MMAVRMKIHLLLLSLLQMKSIEHEPALVSLLPKCAFVPLLAYDPSLVFVPSYVPIFVSSSSDDGSEDENPPPPTYLPPNESIEHENVPI